eukprot:972079-Karenia_brevis.AAC.1
MVMMMMMLLLMMVMMMTTTMMMMTMMTMIPSPKQKVTVTLNQHAVGQPCKPSSGKGQQLYTSFVMRE